MDIVSHVLGGLFVGFAALWFVFFSGFVRSPKMTHTSAFILVIMVVVVVAVSWEVFEFSIGVFEAEDPFPDTTHDLFAGVSGALIAYFYLLTTHRDLIWKKGQNQN